VRFLGRRPHVVDADALRDRLDQIEDVVHARDQAVDVVAVDRRDEGLVQRFDALVRDLVTRARSP